MKSAKIVEKLIDLSSLVLLQLVAIVPFRYTTTFAERDCYRMLIGLLDTINHERWFESGFLYNREGSFGYYAIIYFISLFTKELYDGLILAMNALSNAASICSVVCLYFVGRALWGRQVAICATIVLTFTPVWWNTALYGHPSSVGLTFLYLSFLCFMEHGLAKNIIGLLFLTAALTCRLDFAMCAPHMCAVILGTRNETLVRSGVRTAAYLAASLVLVFALKALLPPVIRESAPESISALLLRYHTVGVSLEEIKTATYIVLRSFSVPLFILIPFVVLETAWRKDFVRMLFVVLPIAINLIFWLPNPHPGRHYIMMSCSLAFGVALLLNDHVRVLRNRGYLAGTLTATIVVCSCKLFDAIPERYRYFVSYYTTRFHSQDFPYRASRVAQPLLSYPQQSTPVVVLCDSNYVVSMMQKLDPTLSIKQRAQWVEGTYLGINEVNTSYNKFIMLEQGWNLSSIAKFETIPDYKGYPVLIDPFNSDITYAGLRTKLDF